MQMQETCVKIEIKDGWLICPRCHRQKLLKLLPDTEAKRLVVYCKHCRQESIVNIEPESLSHRA